MNKIAAAVMILGLLPLAGCVTPHHRSDAYAGYSSGPYAGYNGDYDRDNNAYGPPAPYYGDADYGPGPGYAGAYSGPAPYSQGNYGPAPYNQSAYSQGYGSQGYYGQTYAPGYGQPGYSQSGYAGAYYSAPPPPVRYPAPASSSYYSTQYRCSCDR